MKKSSSLNAICLVSLFFFVNWSTEETTIESRRKQEVNFYGNVITQQGKTYKVENISIARLYKQISLYEAPSKTDKDHILSSDPKRGIITKIDLVEIYNIHVPHPKTIWTYQRKNGYRKAEYVEIIITSNDQQKTKNSYLIDLQRKVICDEVNDAGPIEKDIPFTALKNLTIEGYKYRDLKKQVPKTEQTKTKRSAA